MFYRLQLIIDLPFCEEVSQFNLLPDLIAAGVTCIQLREKKAPLEKIEACAKKLVTFLRPFHTPLIINDYVDLVEKTGADGVHLGQQDRPYREARKMLGPEKIIGLSIGTKLQAVQAKSFDANYFSVGPVFDTPTKKDAASSINLIGLSHIASLLYPKPIIAIGGIQSTHMKDLFKNGAHGAAVMSAILNASDPLKTTHDFFKHYDTYYT